MGIFWKDKVIICSCNPIDKIAEIIHETGHIFADESNPIHSNEFNFWGWEYALAKKLNIIKLWKKNNDDYQVVFNKKIVPFHSLNESEKRQVIKKQYQLAIKNKLIIKNYPISIR